MIVKFSVVIPVYRAVDTLPILVDHIQRELGAQLHEIIFVFDYGNPFSLTKIKELCATHNFVKGIELSRNYGQHNATICGFSVVNNSRFIITMDEDLQHLPEDIQKLIHQQTISEADVIYGIYEERSHSFFRNLTSKLLKKLLEVGIPELSRHYSSFRLIKTEIAKQTIGMRNSYTFLDGYLTWVTNSVSAIPVSHGSSQAGQSSYSIRRLVEHSINIFVTFSVLPIRLLTYFSILFFFLSFSYSIYIIISKLTIIDYDAGFPTLVSMLGFGFGSILLGLGIIGEYIQRINLKTTNRPNFVIKEIFS